MKPLFALLTLSPVLALAHGNHADAPSDALHGLLHAALSLEGFVVAAALSAVVYFIFIKK